jgi:tRNA nucleotidyltransferase (CCA-adding enzyme)
VLERLRALAGGAELLAVSEEHDGSVELVGGAVRDLLLGLAPRELDVVVDGDARAFAAALARRLDVRAATDPRERREPGERRESGARHEPACELIYHERFGTAQVVWESGEIDVAMRRGETYPSPGALPAVAPGTPEQDLARRDFAINAIAVALGPERRGRLRAVAGALEDLAARRLRVLHDHSFLEDPTRLLRLARYKARLGFEVDPHTAALAGAAIDSGALETVSGERLGAELRLAFAEADPVDALAEMDRMGVLQAWEPGVSFDEHVVRTALEILPEDGSKSVMLAAALLLELTDRPDGNGTDRPDGHRTDGPDGNGRDGLDGPDTESSMPGFLHDLQLPSGDARRAFGAAVSAAFVIDNIDSAETAAELLELTLGTPVESLALAAAVCDMRAGPGSRGRRIVDEWLRERRHIEPQVTGDDLIAAGVPEGPEVGARLQESYRLLMEQRIEPGRETELRAALEASL